MSGKLKGESGKMKAENCGYASAMQVYLQIAQRAIAGSSARSVVKTEMGNRKFRVV